MVEPAAKLRFELGPTIHVPAVSAFDEDNWTTVPVTVSVLLLRLTVLVLLSLPVMFSLLPFRMTLPALVRFPAVVKFWPPSKLKLLPLAMLDRLASTAKLELAPLSVTFAPASAVMLELLAKSRLEPAAIIQVPAVREVPDSCDTVPETVSLLLVKLTLPALLRSSTVKLQPVATSWPPELMTSWETPVPAAAKVVPLAFRSPPP